MDFLPSGKFNQSSSIDHEVDLLTLTLKSPNTNYFAIHARRDLAEEHSNTLTLVNPSLNAIDSMTTEIKTLDKAIEVLAETRYPETARLMAITGVGALTALTFVLVVGDPERFVRPRDIGAYLGLVPKRDQSGDVDKELRISCKGDAYMRRLLVGCAQYILGPFGPDCDMRRRGLELAARVVGHERRKKQ